MVYGAGPENQSSPKTGTVGSNPTLSANFMIAAAPACLCFLKEKRVQSAPKWLGDQMEALKKMPPPTIEEVKIQLKASAEFRKWLRESAERKGGRVDDGAGLLNQCPPKTGTVGSNPTPSANL